MPIVNIATTLAQRLVLRLLEERGGEIAWRFGVTGEDTEKGTCIEERLKLANAKVEGDKQVREMAQLHMGLVTIVPIVNSIRPYEECIRLTDAGRAIIDFMKTNPIFQKESKLRIKVVCVRDLPKIPDAREGIQ